MRGARLIGVVAAVVVVATGCGAGDNATTTAQTTATTPPAQQSAAVVLHTPTPADTLRATRTADGTLRATLDVRGRAVDGQTLRVHLSCPDRSCTRFVLSDDTGAFAARMQVVLPATLSRLTISVDYAVIVDPRTAATVRVSVHRPRTPRRRSRRSMPSAGTTATLPPHQAATIPNQTAPPSIPAPSTTTTPAGARTTMTVIGDSLAVGMRPYLGSMLPGWTVTVDGRVGRPLAEGIGIVRAARLPAPGSSVLAISLFTNDDPRGTTQLSSAVDETLRTVGSSGCVIWATIARDPVGGVSYAAANALLQRKAASTPRLRIADWAGYVRAHPGTLSAGNVHPGPTGYQARAALYAQAAAGCP